MAGDQLRYRLKQWCHECDAVIESALQRDVPPILPEHPPECVGMTCGAKTRSGSLCDETDIYRNGRCRIHGGLSTGPKTLEGKRRSALNTGKTYEELISSRAK